MGNPLNSNNRQPLKVAAHEELKRYSTIHLIHQQMEVIAELSYDERERKFYAFLPGSELFNSLGDMKILLTHEMVERLLLRPDGNIELHY